MFCFQGDNCQWRTSMTLSSAPDGGQRVQSRDDNAVLQAGSSLIAVPLETQPWQQDTKGNRGDFLAFIQQNSNLFLDCSHCYSACSLLTQRAFVVSHSRLKIVVPLAQSLFVLVDSLLYRGLVSTFFFIWPKKDNSVKDMQQKWREWSMKHCIQFACISHLCRI